MGQKRKRKETLTPFQITHVLQLETNKKKKQLRSLRYDYMFFIKQKKAICL